jgi:hypothetical protein
MCREEQRERPLLGEKENLSMLRSEYTDSSTVFLPKLNSLTKQYRHFRRTRQDGNCFYRSFLFGLLETLIFARDAAVVERVSARVKGWRAKLIDIGFQELIFEDALNVLVELLDKIERFSVCSTHVQPHTQHNQKCCRSVLDILARDTLPFASTPHTWGWCFLAASAALRAPQ